MGIRTTVTTMQRGLGTSVGRYDPRALIGLIIGAAGVVAEIAHKISERPEMVAGLPAVVQPIVAALVSMAPVAELLLLLGLGVAAQGKPPIVSTPLAGAPSLLDDESGA